MTEAAHLARARGPSRIGPHILVVEDDADLGEVLFEELSATGYEVDVATDGLQGLSMMRATLPDLVLVDLCLPRMDGWQLRIEQRKDPRLARIPMIAMSASGSSAARAVDADLFIAKPFEIRTIVDAIDNILTARTRQDDLERGIQRDRIAALERLAGGLAHEINNPLTYLLLSLEGADRMLSTTQDQKAGSARTLLASALEGGQRIRRIVDSVRILTTGRSATLAPVDVRGVVHSTLALMEGSLRERVTVVTRFAQVPFVMADEGQLGQVLLNLLTNAVQAFSAGGPLDNQITVDVRADDADRAVVEIADNGAGIPDYLLHRVFEPFFTTKPVGEGTGLGLSVCRGIITRFGGEIEIASPPGGGTRVRISLPCAHAANE